MLPEALIRRDLVDEDKSDPLSCHVIGDLDIIDLESCHTFTRAQAC
jgi:hypothetical protein